MKDIFDGVDTTLGTLNTSLTQLQEVLEQTSGKIGKTLDKLKNASDSEQMDKTVNYGKEGTGLGLAIVKGFVQKMNGRKKYIGELYGFYRKNRSIGKGGNGAVYEVELLSGNGLNFPVVAKFFEYEGPDKEKRYKRFKNEIPCFIHSSRYIFRTFLIEHLHYAINILQLI